MCVHSGRKEGRHCLSSSRAIPWTVLAKRLEMPKTNIYIVKYVNKHKYVLVTNGVPAIWEDWILP